MLAKEALADSSLKDNGSELRNAPCHYFCQLLLVFVINFAR